MSVTRLWPHVCVLAAITASVVLLGGRHAPDTERYLAEATYLVRDGVFAFESPTPTVRDVPGFACLLAAFLWCGLDAEFWARLLNVLWLPLIAMASARAAIVLCPRAQGEAARAQLIAFYLTGLSPSLLGSALFPLTELPFTAIWFWAIVLLLEAISWPSADRLPRWAAAGLCTGIACLIRPLPLFFPLVALPVALWQLTRQRHGDRRPTGGWPQMGWRAGAFLAAMAVVILPWTWRNLQVTGRPTPLAYVTGMHLSIGANQEALGAYQDFEPLAPLLAQGLTVPQADDQLRQEAWHTIRAAPGAWIELIPRKWARLWLGVPGSKRQIASRSLVAGLTVFNVAMLALAGVGVWLCRRHPAVLWLLLPALYVTLVHSVLFAIPRFRIPAEPGLLVFAGIALAISWARHFRLMRVPQSPAG